MSRGIYRPADRRSRFDFLPPALGSFCRTVNFARDRAEPLLAKSVFFIGKRPAKAIASRGMRLAGQWLEQELAHQTRGA
jgi:hypothetical protein